jgi:hypothetical protein
MKNSTRVVVTGIGILGSLGSDRNEILSALATKRSLQRQSCPGVARASVSSSDTGVAGRLLRKIDAFAHFGLRAADMAIVDRGLGGTDLAPERVGVFVGNCFGGWGRTDNELRSLYLRGRVGVSPYQATAWFPAAPQGQISIKYGYKGYSKTLSSDRISGLLALGQAAQAIAEGRIDVAVAGACEALATPYVEAMLGRKCEGNDSHPFNDTSKFVDSEGAAFLILESAQRAASAGVTIYGAINGFATGFCSSKSHLASQIGRVIKKSRRTRSPRAGRQLVLLDGVAEEEQTAARSVYGDVAYAAPKTELGNMYSVSGVMESALALLAMSGTATPWSHRAEDDMDIPFTSAAVHGSAENGGFAALQLSSH